MIQFVSNFIFHFIDALNDIDNKNISTFYIKVFDLNSQNIVVWRYENTCNTF